MNLLSNEYILCQKYIINKYEKGKTWEQIKYFNTNNEEDLLSKFNSFKEIIDLEQLSIDDWYEIFEHVKSDKESEVDIKVIGPTMIPSSAGYNYDLNNILQYLYLKNKCYQKQTS